MRNKKLAIYVLLPVVVIIWGAAIFQIFKVINPDSVAIKNLDFDKLPKSSKNNMPDTFSIVANYRDPFLGRSENHLGQGIKYTVAPVLKKPEIRIAWPALAYKGMIRNKKSNKQLVMVSIAGKTSMMNSGDEINGVGLIAISNDSVELSFQNEKKWLRK